MEAAQDELKRSSDAFTERVQQLSAKLQLVGRQIGDMEAKQRTLDDALRRRQLLPADLPFGTPFMDPVDDSMDNLLPLLKDYRDAPLIKPQTTLRKELNRVIAKAKTDEARKEALNRFKDQELFRIDMKHIVEPGTGKFDQFIHLAHAFLHFLVVLAARCFQQGVTQHGEGRLDLASAAFFQQYLEDVPDVAGRFEIFTTITRFVQQLHQPPGLQFLEAHAHVRARKAQRLGHVVGVDGAWREVNEGVDLTDGAVDAPAAAHLAEMADETLHERAEYVVFHVEDFRNFSNV